jgi:GDPmannose 4,6-dehydratase
MVNGVAFNSILETIRIQKLDTRVYQACTSEMFGSTLPPQSLISEFKPQSPYAASKVFAYNVSQNYRHAYNMHITCGIFFNHESHRRGLNFVTKKIVDSLVKIKKKEIEIVKLGNLESSRDWGWAPEYVVAMWQMLQKDCPIDLVVGTGVSAKVIDFFRHSSFILDLDPNRLIEIDPSYVRPLEVESLCADTAEMSRVLGWTPKVKWQELAKIMIEDQLINRERKIEWEKLIHQDLQF